MPWSEAPSATLRRVAGPQFTCTASGDPWKAEPRCTRGGQPRYSALAITTALTLRAVSVWRYARPKG